MIPAAHEKRKRKRVRSRHAAWIRPRDNARLIPCVLWDQSETGARIAAAYSNKLPDVFTLINDKQTARVCRIVWRKGPLIGVCFVEAAEAAEELAAAQSRKPAQPKPSQPIPADLVVSGAIGCRVSLDDPANQGGFALSSIAAGFVLLLIALTAVFYVAGHQSAAGTLWAAAVCDEAKSMCQHPEFSAGAGILMAVVYFAAKGMEL